MDYYREEKEGNFIGFTKPSHWVLIIDEAMHKLFWSTKKCNSKTTEFCYTLAAGVTSTLLAELEDTSKLLFNTYLLPMASTVKLSLIIVKRWRYWGWELTMILPKGCLLLSLISSAVVVVLIFQVQVPLDRCGTIRTWSVAMNALLQGKRLRLIPTMQSNWVHSIFKSDEREDDGVGDQLIEIQLASWKNIEWGIKSWYVFPL